VSAGDEPDRVAVGRRFRDRIRGDVAAGTGLGLDDDRLPELFRESVGDDARQRVGRAASGKSMQQSDRARRIIVGKRRAGRKTTSKKTAKKATKQKKGRGSK